MKKTVNKRKKHFSEKTEKKDILLRGNEELDTMIEDLQEKLPMLEKKAAIVRYAVKQLHRKMILNNVKI